MNHIDRQVQQFSKSINDILGLLPFYLFWACSIWTTSDPCSINCLQLLQFIDITLLFVRFINDIIWPFMKVIERLLNLTHLFGRDLPSVDPRFQPTCGFLGFWYYFHVKSQIIFHIYTVHLGAQERFVHILKIHSIDYSEKNMILTIHDSIYLLEMLYLQGTEYIYVYSISKGL